MASLTEELIERLGGTAGVGAAGIAALMLAPRVSRPVGRGLRALAKGAIKGYLVVSHRARVAVHEATDEWQSLYDQARTEVRGEAPGVNGRIAENGADAEGDKETGRKASVALSERRTKRESAGTEIETATDVAARQINLNLADKEALMLLPGVGERTAEKILQDREEHGRIASLQELQDADILFGSTAENLQDRVGF